MDFIEQRFARKGLSENNGIGIDEPPMRETRISGHIEYSYSRLDGRQVPGQFRPFHSWQVHVGQQQIDAPPSAAGILEIVGNALSVNRSATKSTKCKCVACANASWLHTPSNSQPPWSISYSSRRCREAEVTMCSNSLVAFRTHVCG
jgi:hypothetical protein